MTNKNTQCESCSKESNKKINTLRFIDKLDSFYASNDLEGARNHLEYWESEARAYLDNCGLLTVLNEQIGFSRKVNDKDLALRAIDEAKVLLESQDLLANPSGATICVNIATTLKAFGKPQEALPIYQKAKEVLETRNLTSSYEYAALLNNRSTALCDLGKYDEAEQDILEAFDILKADGSHDGEIAVSLINLAHLIYDRNENDINRVESVLDIAIEHLESENIKHDGNYAFVLSKCVPSLRYFKRDELADKYDKLSKEIYNK